MRWVYNFAVLIVLIFHVKITQGNTRIVMRNTLHKNLMHIFEVTVNSKGSQIAATETFSPTRGTTQDLHNTPLHYFIIRHTYNGIC